MKKISFNGWLLPGNSEVGVLHPYDAPFSVFRKKKIELRESGAGKRRWAARDRKQLFKAIGYCLMSGLYFLNNSICFFPMLNFS